MSLSSPEALGALRTPRYFRAPSPPDFAASLLDHRIACWANSQPWSRVGRLWHPSGPSPRPSSLTPVDARPIITRTVGMDTQSLPRGFSRETIRSEIRLPRVFIQKTLLLVFPSTLFVILVLYRFPAFAYRGVIFSPMGDYSEMLNPS